MIISPFSLNVTELGTFTAADVADAFLMAADIQSTDKYTVSSVKVAQKGTVTVDVGAGVSAAGLNSLLEEIICSSSSSCVVTQRSRRALLSSSDSTQSFTYLKLLNGSDPMGAPEINATLIAISLGVNSSVSLNVVVGVTELTAELILDGTDQNENRNFALNVTTTLSAPVASALGVEVSHIVPGSDPQLIVPPSPPPPLPASPSLPEPPPPPLPPFPPFLPAFPSPSEPTSPNYPPIMPRASSPPIAPVQVSGGAAAIASSDGLSGTAATGLYIGIGVALIVGLGVAFVCYRKRREQQAFISKAISTQNFSSIDNADEAQADEQADQRTAAVKEDSDAAGVGVSSPQAIVLNVSTLSSVPEAAASDGAGAENAYTPNYGEEAAAVNTDDAYAPNYTAACGASEARASDASASSHPPSRSNSLQSSGNRPLPLLDLATPTSTVVTSAEVLVPENAVVGEDFSVKLEDGREVVVNCPDGAAPGDILEIDVPYVGGGGVPPSSMEDVLPRSPKSPLAPMNVRLGAEEEDDGKQMETAEVTVPGDCQPGDTFVVESSWGGLFEVEVPSGTIEGSTLFVELPLPPQPPSPDAVASAASGEGNGATTTLTPASPLQGSPMQRQSVSQGARFQLNV